MTLLSEVLLTLNRDRGYSPVFPMVKSHSVVLGSGETKTKLTVLFESDNTLYETEVTIDSNLLVSVGENITEVTDYRTIKEYVAHVSGEASA